MPNFYSRIFLYNENPKYTFREKPDLICIDLGTNDFSTNGGDSARYVGGYINFIDSIQHYYRNPEIICLLGPMLNGTSLNRVRKYVQFVATFANNREKGKVHFFELSEQTGDLGIGIDSHPSVAQHLKNSRELTNYISTLKSWPVIPQILKAEVETPNKLSIQFNTEIKVPSSLIPGFIIKVAGKPYTITSTYNDASDSSKLYITLDELITPAQTVELSYQKGQLSGKGDILVESIDQLTVENMIKTNVR